MARGASRRPQACDAASHTPVNNSPSCPDFVLRHVSLCPGMSKNCPGHVPAQARGPFAGADLQTSNPGQCPGNRIEKEQKEKEAEEDPVGKGRRCSVPFGSSVKIFEGLCHIPTSRLIGDRKRGMKATANKLEKRKGERPATLHIAL